MVSDLEESHAVCDEEQYHVGSDIEQPSVPSAEKYRPMYTLKRNSPR